MGGASVDPEEHPEMETLGFINRSVELPYSRAKRYIKQCVEKYGELGSYNIVVFLTICISYANNCFTL